MKQTLFLLILFFSVRGEITGQDSVDYRIILISNAGNINTGQKSVLEKAARQTISQKTIVLFLGNNIKPNGIALPGNKAERSSKDILQSQYSAFRKNKVPIYFIPGNDDWDNSGPHGYKKIIRLNEFIKEQNDSLLEVIPKDACTGPFELNLNDKLVVVAMDSEWWLYPFDKHMEESDCECKTKRDVLSKLDDIIQRNYNKTIILATSHSFKSYGPHGGYYPLKQHLFPLTGFNKNLFIPLPVIGSVYPLFRKTFPPIADAANNAYEGMIGEIIKVVKSHPNVIHVAGNENSLQLINHEILEVISGSASNTTAVKKGKESLYAQSAFGFALVDLLKTNMIKLTYISNDNKKFRSSFTFHRQYLKPILRTYDSGSSNIIADTMKLSLGDQYMKVSGIHKSLFGENYRRVWSTKTTFRVLKLSTTDLKPKELGGGMQTYSLRLTDMQQKEWVFRSIEKYPVNILPEALRTTFVVGILKDNVTATFPYGALTVPVFSDALGVPHSNPAIVYIAPDKKLGIYSRDFANTIDLFEEREPLGKSISTIKMIAELKEDNDNEMDQKAYLTARLQDIFLGDWDRHGDQWKWVDLKKGKGKTFKGVPRDRDQVFYIYQGLFLKILALPWVMPKFQGFGSKIKNINALSFNARFIDGIFTNKLSEEDWKTTTGFAVKSLTDSVIETALKRMPSEIFETTHSELERQLKERRQDLFRATPRYYRFLNKVIDITTSDKREMVTIKDTLNGRLMVKINKISKNKEIGKVLLSRVLEPSKNKEIRLYLHGGEDSVSITNSSSPIKLRIVGDGKSVKKYVFSGTAKYLKNVHIYDGVNNALAVNNGIVHKHLSNDAANTSFEITNRYNNTIPLLNAGYNIDDGLILGAGVKFIRQGFRKQPYGSNQQITFAHSFSTKAYKFNYKGEWIQAAGKADLLFQVKALAPNNTQNFFGRGNKTGFNKTGDYRQFYRTRFNFYEVEPALRWRIARNARLTAGSSFQYYHYEPQDNRGYFITDHSKIHSYDSATVSNDKSHAGIFIALTNDSRNDVLIPTYGCYMTLRIQGNSGLNNYSKSFGQLLVEISVFKSIGRKSSVVIANRLGGGVTAGKTTFYQSLFLGGHENLRGFHQYRFAGEHMLFNNLEARIKLTDVVSYILPGQLGIVALYDVGRVWQKGYNDNAVHQGVGGGVYFAPAHVAVFQFVAANSRDGWYPYFTFGFRF